MSKTLVTIVGPTACGKTAVAIKIAQMLQCEIISCDSRQMYREMTIGTAKPDLQQLTAVKHHFINNLSISDYYNASMFEVEGLEVLNSLFNTSDIAIMTGGSGMYADALCRGIDDLPTIDPEVRRHVDDLLMQEGIAGLRMRLHKCDPDYYAKVDLNNPKRITKALEVFFMTGKPYSSMLTNNAKKRDFRVVKIGLNRQREELNRLINLRVDQMIDQGLVDEARSLVPSRHLNALNTVGYKELFESFDGLINISEAIEKIKSNTRKYAKRQVTWFIRDKEITWFSPHEIDKIMELIVSKK
jgi:tRNA dimethylallyltransferase